VALVSMAFPIDVLQEMRMIVEPYNDSKNIEVF
jgi:hypothetical protein